MREAPVVDWAQLLRAPEVRALVDLAVAEDVGSGDVTTEAIFSAAQPVQGRVLTRRETVVCGVPLAAHIFARFDESFRIDAQAAEGRRLAANETLFAFAADVRAVLTAERTALNFLMRLCGIAAAARRAVEAVPRGCRAKIYDTRKMTPGWRRLEKAAVRTGGAQNHRFGLFDAVLIKDNHVAAAGGVGHAVERARAHTGGRLPIEAEIDCLEQLEEALAAGAEIILLDNMSDAEMRRAVELTHGRAELEASGGITLTRIPEVALSGVDRISLGALTHTVEPADLSLELSG